MEGQQNLGEVMCDKSLRIFTELVCDKDKKLQLRCETLKNAGVVEMAQTCSCSCELVMGTKN